MQTFTFRRIRFQNLIKGQLSYSKYVIKYREYFKTVDIDRVLTNRRIGQIEISGCH